MRAPLRTIGLTLGLLLGVAWNAAAAPGPGGFTFAPPAGWIDVSKGAPEAQRKNAPPAILQQADSGQMAFLAYEPNSADDGFIENVNAVVQTGKRPPRVTLAGLSELEKALETAIAQNGMTYRSLKVEVVKVAGVTAGRLVGEVNPPSGTVNMVQYAIPGERSFATLTFSTTPEKLAHYEPIFAAAAQSTLGALDAGDQAASENLGMLTGAIAGGIGGAIGGLYIRRSRRKRQAAAPATTPAASGPA
jgi:hypothetical protein